MSWAPNTYGNWQSYLPRVKSKWSIFFLVFKTGVCWQLDLDPFQDTTLLIGITTCREKRHRKQNFDLLTAVHEAEYSNLKRPVDPKTKRAIEPAHKFEVIIEDDSISQRKYVRHCPTC